MSQGSTQALPFLTLPDEAIKDFTLLVGRKGEPLLPVEDIFENWDYSCDLVVQASLDVDWDLAMSSLELSSSETKLRCTLSIGTGQGRNPRIRWTTDNKSLDRTTNHCELSGVIEGKNLSGSLHLQVSILLGEPAASASRISPVKACSRLWTYEHAILLEGGGDARFPLESISFSGSPKLRRFAEAPWYVQWNEGPLQSDYTAAVRLLVNTDCKEWHDRILEADRLVLQMMVADVAQILCQHVVSENEMLLLHECPVGSVGHQIKFWLEQAFGQSTPENLKQLLDTNPAGFRAGILAACALREDEE